MTVDKKSNRDGRTHVTSKHGFIISSREGPTLEPEYQNIDELHIGVLFGLLSDESFLSIKHGRTKTPGSLLHFPRINLLMTTDSHIVHEDFSPLSRQSICKL